MDGIDQLLILNDEYIRSIIQPQDYKHNLVALIKSFTEDELKRLSKLLETAEDTTNRGH